VREGSTHRGGWVSPPGTKVVLVDASLALYRRYRPDTFADVIGQDHVTVPLSQALDHNRVHHAYLFSGPRGCGKTTSARIMARALNCDKGPISVPCGECESCVELARGGPGSIDVIEIDAASHGGVDDARDLRERAFFTPMKARYKVYIIDEAHMVTPQGFNAMLKLVEEPPSHLRFIFATTEPDKVIGTIRSRTHHYPFRLVPPKLLGDYLLDLCGRENVRIEPTVIPLIVRAGAGSVRDSLSVLDQLIGGSGSDGVTYTTATALLGYTPDTLLDETVDALAADDGATLFGVIEKVVETGQDPRRFAEDLLQRLRDLVVVSAVPGAASRGLIELSDDSAERLTGQAARFGRAELTRAADIVSQGLTDMRGATAPRLLLEIMCARILLPGVDASVEGLGARLDRIERRLSVVGEAASPTPARTSPRTSPEHAAQPPSTGQPGPPLEPGGDLHGHAAEADPRPIGTIPTSAGEPSEGEPAASASAASFGDRPTADEHASSAPRAASSSTSSTPPSAGQLGVVDVRRLWPGVLDRVKQMRRYAWILLSQNAHVKDVGPGVITIGLTNVGARDSFTRSGADEILHQALIEELGVDWRVDAIIDASDQPRAGGPPVQEAPTSSSGPPEPELAKTPRSTGVEAAKGAIRPTRPTSSDPAGAGRRSAASAAEVHDDDEVIDDASLSSHELLSRELGARVIEDIRHDPV
jgi:DNA polymerase-3 subunit gamma/tau